MVTSLAHLAEDGREQLLIDHLDGVAQLCEGFAAPFGGGLDGRCCGLAHDLGKRSAQFQRRIRGEDISVDHSTAGAQVMQGAGGLAAAFCVAGHHGGLPDGGAPGDTGDDATLFGRMKRTVPAIDGWETALTLPKPPTPPFRGGVDLSFYIRMLYSCLVDADFLDTESFMSNGAVQRQGGASISALAHRLDAYLEAHGFRTPSNELNRQRAHILKACLDGGEHPPGLYTLTVPTGGGKTISSLAFALRHAAAHGLSRVIYIIPYLSIIDQTAATFRDILGEENVLEHHSGVIYETGEEGFLTADATQKARAIENWDAPVIVTTAVQFFQSLYANRSSHCRKNHNIARSVMIFDEAQMLPLPCLKPCVAAITQLVEHYGATAVLCTATQPALEDIIRQLAPTLRARELSPQSRPHPVFHRVTFQHAGDLDNLSLAQALQQHQQVLCIVNNRKQAQEIYAQLTGEGNYHLSTLLYPAHRRALLEEVRSRLKAGLPCRVVSTSLIEAGVDVDFPAVYRAEAGLDSILQAAGRCNREGKRTAKDSVVTVFHSESTAPALLSANISAAKEALSLHPNPADHAAINCYFRTLLDFKGDAALDMYGVLDAFARGERGRLLPFRSVAERFRMIDSAAVTVYIPLGEGAALCDQLLAGGCSRQLFRRLGQYGVTVYPKQFAALCHSGDIVPTGENAGVLRNAALYYTHTGLALSPEEGLGIFI